MLQVSVIICSHNPKLNYLRRTLDALRAQTLVKDQWELLLVDNASKPPLASCVDISWHPNARNVPESELGLAAARRRGIREAAADLLVFVDDDNMLNPSYLSEALRISQEWSQLGVFGSGAIIPEFECEPAEYLKRFVHFLSLRENEKDCWTNVIPNSAATPWGAGMYARAKVAMAYLEFSERSLFKILDRQGGNLISGQDMEIGYFACSRGLGMGNFKSLKLTHLIPKQRVEEKYILRMMEGQELAWALLSYKWSGIVPRSPFSLREALSLAKTILLRKKIDRQVQLARLRATAKARRTILDSTKAARRWQVTEI